MQTDMKIGLAARPKTPATRTDDTADVWHPERMAGKEIDRVRATSALEVVKQHPLLMLFALSPVLVGIGLIWVFADAFWAILALVALVVAGGAFVVLKR